MTKTAQHELDGCKHLKITDTGEDIFDHPAYQYGCLLKNKNLRFGVLQCYNCFEYEDGHDDTLS